jgi:hypothetical protein
LQAIRTALQDSDRHVRFEAILALRGHGLASRPLAPDLINMLQDADPQVRFIADFVLWQIDAPLAVKAGGWVPFSSRPWGFSAMFPAKPEEEEGTTEIQDNLVTVHSFAASHGTMRFMVGISEYPPEGDSVPLDQWYDTVRDYALTGLGGRLLRETSLEVNGHKGREKEVEVQGKGVLRSRLFRVNGRLYQALVAYDPKFLNSAAVACFLDSFRLEHDGD